MTLAIRRALIARAFASWRLVAVVLMFSDALVLVPEGLALLPSHNPPHRSVGRCRVADIPLLPWWRERRTGLEHGPDLGPSETTTSLSMGIRSILGIGKGRSDRNKNNNNNSRDGDVDDDDLDDNDEDVLPNVFRPPVRDDLSSSRASPPSPQANGANPPAGLTDPINNAAITGIPGVPNVMSGQDQAPPVRMGEDPHTKEVNVHTLDNKESIQDRINRVKAGKMTEEEKMAFLQTALTAGNTPESRMPLRSASPTAEEEEEMKSRSSASPFPTDSILRNFARGKNPASPEEEEQMEESKKQYLDMITNPERFNRYRAQSAGGDNVNGDGGDDINGARETDGAYADGQDEPEYSPLQEDGAHQEELLQTAQQEPQDLELATAVREGLPNGLGARLGAAALANESLKKQAEEEKRQQEEDLVAKKIEEEEKLAEDMRRRHEEMQRRESEMMRKKREEEESATREQERKKTEDKQRLEEMMKAQEEYWVKRLATERAKHKQFSAAPNGAEQAVSPPPPPEQPMSTPESQWNEVPAANGADTKESTSSVQFNPDESDILGGEWEGGKGVVNGRGSGQYSPPANFLNDVRRMNPGPINEKRKPQNVRDRAKFDRRAKDDDQVRRLRELNSPLPSPPSARNQAATPRPPPKFEPQRAVAGKATARPASGNVLQNVNSSGSPVNGATAPQGAGGVEANNRKKNDVRVNGAPSPPPFVINNKHAPPYSVNPPKVVSPRSEAARPPPAAQSSPPPLAAQSSPPPPPPPAAQSAPPPARTGPIRMQLPLGDDEDDEDDYGEINKKMSIADIMRQQGKDSDNQEDRSKKWGVDMSKFLDD